MSPPNPLHDAMANWAAPGGPADGPSVPHDRPLWVFGYGSLMWNPGFAHARRSRALLYGYHRRFCIRSLRYRGTPDAPGLVLGLDRGGSCVGMAFLVMPPDIPAALDYLWQREMATGVYRPKLLQARLIDEGPVTVYGFVADRHHGQYCHYDDPDDAARLIASRSGPAGPNWEYLANTVAHLDELGIGDGPLHDLLDRVRATMGGRLPDEA